MPTDEDRQTAPSDSQTPRTPFQRDLHFDLRWLGPAHETETYRLHCGKERYELRRHTLETFAASAASGSPTHFAKDVKTSHSKVGLSYVTGPDSPEGFPTLASISITTATDKGSYCSEDVAKALIFLNPTITVLTPKHANTVLGHIENSDGLSDLKFILGALGKKWCTPKGVVDSNGNPVKKTNGKQYYTYELNQGVLNTSPAASAQSKALIYSDKTLEGARWKLLPGVSFLDMNARNKVAAVRQASREAGSNSGYNIDLQDGGPNFGVSVEVNGLSDDFVLDLSVTNSFIRYTSVFVSFLKADGTAMKVPDNIWTKMVKGAAAAIVQEWFGWTGEGQDLLKLLKSSDNTLMWLGNVGPESTFLGIPISDSNTDFQFAMPPDQGKFGKVRLLVGSLGVGSNSDWDPTAAWLGLSLTVFFDLALPTYSLIMTVGEESNEFFDSFLDDPTFVIPTAYAVFQLADDVFTGSSNLGGDISSELASLGDAIASRVLTAPEVAAKLAALFGAEEAEDAIPFVGWGLQLLAVGATVAQLAQTVAEVIGSPRVVEFDLTITMNGEITLVPDLSTGSEFPDTATSFTITAQYSDNTTRTYTGTISNPKVAKIVVPWNDLPVGGTVSFVVAMFSKEGWGVGKGQSAVFSNQINDSSRKLFVAKVSVKQELYPLSCHTTYCHSQLLGYEGSGPGYLWNKTSNAPKETAENLGPPQPIRALSGITLSDDLGVLGYSWEASGLNIPPVGGGGTENVELYTMQNIGYRPIQGDASWPEAGYMTAPAGYSAAPLLLYLRTAKSTGSDAVGPGFFYLDPTGNPTTGYHLRQVTPVTDPNVPMNDPSRQFNLATGTSWGRFAILPSSLAIHSNGYVVGVNPQYNTMQILALPRIAATDAEAPWAWIPLGPGTVPGRLQSPALAAIRPDQTILVLEAGNQRIQAFSRGGHPVAAFDGSDTPYWIPLVPHAQSGINVVYLSMCVDVANYVYVLSQNGNGYDATMFNLDVYTPTGKHLFCQQELVAGGMAVDLWRNVYTLNFQQICGPGGRPEPSISEWIPSTPVG